MNKHLNIAANKQYFFANVLSKSLRKLTKIDYFKSNKRLETKIENESKNRVQFSVALSVIAIRITKICIYFLEC